jgi:hypothetical protein
MSNAPTDRRASPLDPEVMSSAERLEEAASLLARGILRRRLPAIWSQGGAQARETAWCLLLASFSGPGPASSVISWPPDMHTVQHMPPSVRFCRILVIP